METTTKCNPISAALLSLQFTPSTSLPLCLCRTKHSSPHNVIHLLTLCFSSTKLLPPARLKLFEQKTNHYPFFLLPTTAAHHHSSSTHVHTTLVTHPNSHIRRTNHHCILLISSPTSPPPMRIMLPNVNYHYSFMRSFVYSETHTAPGLYNTNARQSNQLVPITSTQSQFILCSALSFNPHLLDKLQLVVR